MPAARPAAPDLYAGARTFPWRRARPAALARLGVDRAANSRLVSLVKDVVDSE
ncbi:hypothetical protein [Streptomyces sp. NPDC089919]|uniref:hypothetical protein n=1 Tax=Streptomyces sp. NPDC089919 TaxID=3155188 RepID=UPI0034174CBE